MDQQPSNVAFEFQRCPGLPKLAWCLELEDSCSVARVVHGEWVITHPERFFEGAWSGDFAEADFARTFMTGTAVERTPEGLLFVTPNHALDRLNVVRKDGVLYVSNSLAFVLMRSGEELDEDVLFYNSYVSSIKYGLKAYEPSIPTRNGVPIHFYYCCNLLLNAAHTLVASAKAPSPAFASYGEYRAFLDETISMIAANAADPRRAVRYEPISTLSRGYDSPAVTVLAMQAGCREALTFRQSSGAVSGEDCGTPIARRLGLVCREFERLAYRTHPDFPEIENSGGPNEFLSFGDALRGRLLFTGFHGDKIWDRNCDRASRYLIRGDASGSSLTEYRLRTGFCHLPVAFIGADRHPEIHAILKSAEMKPWSVGGAYDRPIPRRIAEEAGVPRELFGRRKRAAGVVVTREGLADTLSESSAVDFARFLDEKWDLTKTLKVLSLKPVRLFARANRYGAKILQSVGRALHLELPRMPNVVPHRLEMLAFGYVGKACMLFHWGVAKLLTRYRTAVPRDGGASGVSAA